VPKAIGWRLQTESLAKAGMSSVTAMVVNYRKIRIRALAEKNNP